MNPIMHKVHHFATKQPIILLPHNFSINTDDIIFSGIDFTEGSFVEWVAINIEKVFKKQSKNITFLALGSSWIGMILYNSCHCVFKISIYKSSKKSNSYIVEGQRIEGDHFLFGQFFQMIRSKIFSQDALLEFGKMDEGEDEGKSEGEDENEGEDDCADDCKDDCSYIDSDEDEYDNPLTLEAKKQYLISIKAMVADDYYKTSLEGIQMVSSATTTRNMAYLIFESDLIPLLVNIIDQINIDEFENNWQCQYALISLLNLANLNCEKFIYTLDEMHLFHIMYARLEHINLQQEFVKYLSPSKQHILNNSKKLFDCISNYFSKKRINFLMFLTIATVVKKQNTVGTKKQSTATFIKALKNKYWEMHISSFI